MKNLDKTITKWSNRLSNLKENRARELGTLSDIMLAQYETDIKTHAEIVKDLKSLKQWIQ